VELVLNRVVGKVKKQFIFLLLIPVILGVVGYFIPVEKGGSTSTAEVTLSLGSDNNTELNDSKSVMTLLSTPTFFEQNLASLWAEKQSDLQTNLKVTAVSDNVIAISYTAPSSNEAINVLNQVTNVFMTIAQNSFQQRQKLIQDSINAIENKKVGPDAIVDQQRFLYEQKTTLLNMKAPVLIQPAGSQDKGLSKALSPKYRGVLGVLLGITFIFIWVVVPELVRKQ
jgi:teichuronic acid biosynthesis protein TuaF